MQHGGCARLGLMNDITVFVGGSLGSEPYAPTTWSGISHNILSAMQRAGTLDKAVGVQLPSWQTKWLQIKNYSRNRAAWRRKFYMDVAFRNAGTHAASQVAVNSPYLLQFGHWFSLPDAFPDKICASYHDGNLAQSSGSGFGMNDVPRQVVDAALRYEEETAQKMAAVFTFSEYLRQSFIHDYRVPAERVFNVGVGADPSPMPEERPDKDYSRNQVLFVGIDFKRKGGEQLLQAFAQVRAAVPDAELHIVGPEQIDQPLGAGVTLHGRLSKKDPVQNAKLDKLFREATLFTLPSLYEPFGLAPVEAMFYEIPCLLSNGWAFREMVTPGETGDLAEVGSARDLATKMIALLSKPEELRRMGKQARHNVSAYYRWDALAARMWAELQTVSR